MENKYFEEGEHFLWIKDLDHRKDAPLRLHLYMEKEKFRSGNKQAMIATETNTGKKYFLKILFCSDIEQVFVEKESKVQLFSPYVIRIYGGMLDDENKRFITAMEYVEEMDLSDMIRQRGLAGRNWKEKMMSAHRIALKFLEGIAYYSSVYEHDPYVHRDLKPENVLASPDGSVVKIIDFDWVHLHDSRLTVHMGREQKGTAGYADPAYWSSSICKKEMDIYSAGLVLYYLYTGRHHFYGNEEIQHYMQADSYAYTLKAMRGIDPQLSDIIARMITFEKDRYHEIEDVLSDFRDYLFKAGITISLPELAQTEHKDPELRLSYKVDGIKYVHYLKNYRFVPVIPGRKQARSYEGKLDSHVMSFYRMDDVVKIIVLNNQCQTLQVKVPGIASAGDTYMYAGIQIEITGIR